MSYLALARKYRPQTFEDVVGQPHVTRTLSNAITAGRLAHAILFAGPRGTGKTTVARILAKAMNCERGPTPTPCNRCVSCREITTGAAPDVHEIDGASNNGVDHVREIRENARYMPVSARHKIYVIDEVHMLSTAAFNALLKTLEEPPAHVLFFFATTEVHKIPITILSRCQRHDLRRVPADAIAAHLRTLCGREGVNLPEESVWATTRQAAGSIRDDLSLLDQVIGGLQGDIDHRRVLELLGVVGQDTLFELLASVLERDTARSLSVIDKAYRSGLDVKAFYAALVTHFRDLLVVKVAGTGHALVEAAPDEREYLSRQAALTGELHLIQLVDALLREENMIRHALQPRVALELAVLRLLSLRPAVPIEELVQRLERLAERAPGNAGESGGGAASPEDPSPREAPRPPRPSAPLAPPPPPEPAASTAPATPPGDGCAEPSPEYGRGGPDREDQEDAPDAAWGRLVDGLDAEFPALGSIVRKSRLAAVEGNALRVQVSGGPTAIARLMRQREVIERLAARHFGRPMTVTAEPWPAETGVPEVRPRPATAKSNSLVADAVDIFQATVVNVSSSFPTDRRSR